MCVCAYIHIHTYAAYMCVCVLHTHVSTSVCVCLCYSCVVLTSIDLAYLLRSSKYWYICWGICVFLFLLLQISFYNTSIPLAYHYYSSYMFQELVSQSLLALSNQNLEIPSEESENKKGKRKFKRKKKHKNTKSKTYGEDETMFYSPPDKYQKELVSLISITYINRVRDVSILLKFDDQGEYRKFLRSYQHSAVFSFHRFKNRKNALPSCTYNFTSTTVLLSVSGF